MNVEAAIQSIIDKSYSNGFNRGREDANLTIAKVTAQRDKLLAALKAISKQTDDAWAEIKAREAIKEVEEAE